MAESEKIIAEFLSKKGLRNKDVEELYLGKIGLTEVCDLQRFVYLKHLWLNGNKLWRINCIQKNLHLTELYLQNNELVDVTGALHHLTCLQVLMLQNNQLSNLEAIMHELRNMQSLDTLNLFSNPVAQEVEYRFFVIRSLPSLRLLDRKEIVKSEKDLARKIYDQEQEEVRQTIAFGRRSQGPPDLYFPLTPVKNIHLHSDNVQSSPGKEIANSFYRDSVIYDDPEEAFNQRRLRNSVKIYTTLNWSKVPKYEERRQSEAPFETPESVTYVYR